jgi:hypothetical protein
MTTSLLEARRCLAGWPRAVTVVVTKSGLTLPHLAVVAGLAAAWYAIGIPRRTS